VIWLSLTFCLVAHPAACKEVVMDDTFDTVQSCMISWQPLAAAWLVEHDGYEFGTALCSPEKPNPEEPA
jgi:hypothetical protein